MSPPDFLWWGSDWNKKHVITILERHDYSDSRLWACSNDFLAGLLEITEKKKWMDSWVNAAVGNLALPLLSVATSAPLQIKSTSHWAICIATLWPNCAESSEMSWEANKSRQRFPPCHIFCGVLGAPAAESLQRKRCQSPNYKQQIYSGQSPWRGWSFVKGEKRKMPLPNMGLVCVIYPGWIIKLWWCN